MNGHKLKWKFLGDSDSQICENKTTAKITTYTVGDGDEDGENANEDYDDEDDDQILYTPYISRVFYFREFRELGAIHEFNNTRK